MEKIIIVENRENLKDLIDFFIGSRINFKVDILNKIYNNFWVYIGNNDYLNNKSYFDLWKVI
jgi:hypothetical protein